MKKRCSCNGKCGDKCRCKNQGKESQETTNKSELNSATGNAG